jgi:FkbM family methyltransferase
MANKFGVFLRKKIAGKDQNLISLDEPYEVMRRLLNAHLVTGILDAGASRGHISERLLKKFPDAHAYAFEPNPLYRQVLKDYAAGEPRFHPQFAALSDHEGTAELHVTESAGNTSLLIPTEKFNRIDPIGAVIKETVSVPIVTIDQWAEDNGGLPIQLIKFDIQGYELTALKGAVHMLEKSTLLIYSEIWFNSVYEGGALFSDIDEFLRRQGFGLYDIYKPKYNRNGLIQWANAMFVHAERLGL